VSQNDADFGSGASITNTFNVATTAEWDSALTTISGGGNDKNYIINVTADFTVAGCTTNSFGAANGVKVAIRGEGRTLTLSSNGRILQIAANQTIILGDVALKGRSFSVDNNTFLVSVSGNFIMNSGEISGNTNHSSSATTNVTARGGGVYVNNGVFTMNGGKISDNKSYADAGSGWARSYGGGVYVDGGTFIMNGGEISDNTARAEWYLSNGSANAFGGGVAVVNNGTFTMNRGRFTAITQEKAVQPFYMGAECI
jgi:hypothetical protein